jgi:CBS domain-containing membrane protein
MGMMGSWRRKDGRDHSSWLTPVRSPDNAQLEQDAVVPLFTSEASPMARAAIAGQHVRDLMTFHAVTVAPDDTVKDALDLLVANNVAALPVVDEANRCVGVISSTDLLGLAQERGEEFEAFYAAEGLTRELLIEHLERADFSDLVVKEAMTPTPMIIGPDAPLSEAARIMLEYGIHHLAVVENRHRFLGVLSSLDIVRALAENQSLG